MNEVILKLVIFDIIKTRDAEPMVSHDKYIIIAVPAGMPRINDMIDNGRAKKRMNDTMIENSLIFPVA